MVIVIARNLQTTLLVAELFEIQADIPKKVLWRSCIFMIVIWYVAAVILELDYQG